MKKEYRKFN